VGIIIEDILVITLGIIIIIVGILIVVVGIIVIKDIAEDIIIVIEGDIREHVVVVEVGTIVGIIIIKEGIGEHVAVEVGTEEHAVVIEDTIVVVGDMVVITGLDIIVEFVGIVVGLVGQQIAAWRATCVVTYRVAWQVGLALKLVAVRIHHLGAIRIERSLIRLACPYRLN